jgi:NADP-dependent 3-hydroxy acid dehydrogenase YdfG
MIKGKVAIITGASSGIGYATALALSKAGAKVAIGARRVDKLEALAKKITDNGGDVFYQKLDVTQRSECDNFAKAVLEKWDSIDILVNNAGLMPLSFFKSLKVDEWDKMIDVNIKGVLYSTGAVITHMKEKKSGHIVNLSSVAGRVVFASGSVYCATKFAIAAFSEGLRKEFSARTNIRVTSIEPGVVDTELNDTITDESLKGFVENTKKMKALHAEDIANAILYAVESPSHVNVNEILIRPTTQEL